MSTTGTDERKTILKTVRIQESLAHSLEEEAADKGTTVNADINSIINQHFSWDKKVREFGFVTLPKVTFMSLIKELDDKAMVRIGREVLPAMFEEMAELWFQGTTPEKILDAINTRFRYDALMHVETSKQGDMYTIVFRHEFGRKWSLMVESAARELTKRYLHVEPRISVGDSVVTVSYKFKSPPSDDS